MPDPSTDLHSRHEADGRRVGVWIFGALGSVATHVVVGAHALSRGLIRPNGLVTAREPWDDVPLCSMDQLVFGGHELRGGSPLQAARESVAKGGGLPARLVDEVSEDLRRFGESVKPLHAGRVHEWSEALGVGGDGSVRPAREELAQLSDDLREFRQARDLDVLIAVNLTSTEPVPAGMAELEAASSADELLDLDASRPLPPSALLSLAAVTAGCPLVDFTPNPALTLPALRRAATEAGVPICGRDGKTGESLLKSVLGPMFLWRNLQLLSWESYNLLGNRDGRVLDRPENRESKLRNKIDVLDTLYDYDFHHRVHIDYVPSLDDWKTAWNLVHFEGFLGARMMLQLTWQGCDSALAAPLVLDLVRLADLSHRRGEAGVMEHTAAFFKAPLEPGPADLADQMRQLLEYALGARDSGRSSSRPAGKSPAEE